MLIARAPVRISFAGGGTDLEAYYADYGGMVVSVTIDKYFYSFVNPTENGYLQISSSDYRSFYRHDAAEPLLWEGDLALPKAIIDHFGLTEGLSVFLASEIPPGTGLGSSSSVAVALIKSLATLCNQSMSPREIAELACYIEIEKLGYPIGKQDQYAASFGGLNAFYFYPDRIEVESLWHDLSRETIAFLERRLLLFFTGASRDSAEILSRQMRSTQGKVPHVTSSLHALKAQAEEIKRCLLAGDLKGFGQALHEGWMHKRGIVADITNDFIDDCYAIAREQGALGGKITGAGGGGFLLLYCEESYQPSVTKALEDRGLARMDFHFDFSGARVLLNAARRREQVYRG